MDIKRSLLALREGHKLQVLENKLLDLKIREQFRISYEERPALYIFPVTVKLGKYGRLRWSQYTARMAEIRNTHRILIGRNLMAKFQLQEQEEESRIILTFFVEE
jgi:hypothetical protein